MTVVVAGGTSGVGLAIAKRLAHPGTSVVLNYFRDSSAADAARRAMAEVGVVVSLCQADLGTLTGVRALAEFVRSNASHIDQLIYASGAGTPGNLLDLDGETLDRAVRLNGTSVAHLTRELSDLLHCGSSVVYITSSGARRAISGYGSLGASKALAEHLVRHLARELAPRGVRVNCVSPGPIDTKARREMFPDTWEARLAEQSAANPSGRGITFDDVAGVVELMTRPEFAMVQGQVLTIDGGLTL